MAARVVSSRKSHTKGGIPGSPAAPSLPAGTSMGCVLMTACRSFSSWSSRSCDSSPRKTPSMLVRVLTPMAPSSSRPCRTLHDDSSRSSRKTGVKKANRPGWASTTSAAAPRATRALSWRSARSRSRPSIATVMTEVPIPVLSMTSSAAFTSQRVHQGSLSRLTAPRASAQSSQAGAVK